MKTGSVLKLNNVLGSHQQVMDRVAALSSGRLRRTPGYYYSSRALNEYRDLCHDAAKNWWVDLKTGHPIKRNKGELIALIHSELSEALEGERKNLMDDKLPYRPMAEVEMADAVIRCFDYAGGFGMDLDAVMSAGLFGIVFERFNGSLSSLSATALDLPMNRALFIGKLHAATSYLFMAEVYGIFGDNGGVAKLVEVLVGIADYCRCFGYDLDGAFKEKLAYNAKREDHTLEHRRGDGGKKF